MNIEEILYKRSEALARLKVLPYSGTPELKEIHGKQYLYVRSRVWVKKYTTLGMVNIGDLLHTNLALLMSDRLNKV